MDATSTTIAFAIVLVFSFIGLLTVLVLLALFMSEK